MPYAYRQMTPEEREETVRRRQERGYPLHSPPHPIRGSGRYLITAANFEHCDIMASPDRRTDFESRLLESMRGIAAEVYGWVVLSNHYHVLIWVSSLNHVSSCLKNLHGKTSYEWNQEDAQTGTRRVWYKYTDRKIRNDDHFYKALNYIHFNPVKHGYVKSAYDWPWSSLQNYSESRGRQWLVDTWQNHQPGDFGKGWDDETRES